MTKTILRKLGGAVAFFRRKIEVWFVLLIVIGVGGLTWAGFRAVEATQADLCRAGHASAATKDKFVDVLARESGRGEDDPAVIELRGYVEEERIQLPCSTPSRSELMP